MPHYTTHPSTCDEESWIISSPNPKAYLACLIRNVVKSLSQFTRTPKHKQIRNCVLSSRIRNCVVPKRLVLLVDHTAYESKPVMGICGLKRVDEAISAELSPAKSENALRALQLYRTITNDGQLLEIVPFIVDDRSLSDHECIKVESPTRTFAIKLPRRSDREW